MRKIILFYTFIIFSSCTYSNNTKNDLKESNLFGNIKSVKEVSYEVKEESGVILKGEKKAYSTRFENTITYNKKGNKIEEIGLEHGTKYNSTIGDWNPAILNHRETYQYDEESDVIIKEKRFLNENLQVELDFEYKYDKYGRIIEEHSFGTYFLNNNYTRIRKNEYNGNNNLVKSYTSVNNNLTNEISYKYDTDNNLIEKKGHGFKSIYTYRNKKLTESSFELYMFGGSQKIAHKYEYDDNGNIIKETDYDEEGEIKLVTTYEYKFDKKGNWIEKTVFENGICKFIIEREIEYYK